MGELMRPVLARLCGYRASPFQRKSVTVSAQERHRFSVDIIKKRHRFSVDNFLSTGAEVGFIHKRKDPPAVPGGSMRDRFSAASLWALRAEATGRE